MCVALPFVQGATDSLKLSVLPRWHMGAARPAHGNGQCPVASERCYMLRVTLRAAPPALASPRGASQSERQWRRGIRHPPVWDRTRIGPSADRRVSGRAVVRYLLRYTNTRRTKVPLGTGCARAQLASHANKEGYRERIFYVTHMTCAMRRGAVQLILHIERTLLHTISHARDHFIPPAATCCASPAIH